MVGQQFNIDTISNNLANVNTTGFKKMRAEFEDLIYQTLLMAGTPATEVSEVPTGIQVGHGVKVSATQKMFSQGSLQSTENKLDLALEGEGFFKIQLYDGTFAYTRDGSFKIDSNRQVVTANGYLLEPPLVLPENFIAESLAISQTGRVTVKVVGEDDPDRCRTDRDLPLRQSGRPSEHRRQPVQDHARLGRGDSRACRA